MGYKYEVWAYEWIDTGGGFGDYEYKPRYTGQFLIKAIWTIWKLRGEKCGCIRTEFRFTYKGE